ncbi:hypothetical protein D1872_223750 [compost metagenome]
MNDAVGEEIEPEIDQDVDQQDDKKRCLVLQRQIDRMRRLIDFPVKLVRSAHPFRAGKSILTVFERLFLLNIGRQHFGVVMHMLHLGTDIELKCHKRGQNEKAQKEALSFDTHDNSPSRISLI